MFQRWWRLCLTRTDAELQQGAVLRLQTAWRGFRERRLFLRRRRAALIIQMHWRRVLQTRHSAARLIQAVWRSLRQRRRFLQQRRAAVTLQAACRGQRERLRSVHSHHTAPPSHSRPPVGGSASASGQYTHTTPHRRHAPGHLQGAARAPQVNTLTPRRRHAPGHLQGVARAPQVITLTPHRAAVTLQATCRG